MSAVPGQERTADDVRMEATLNVLASQRESALNLVAELRGEIAAKDFELRDLQRRIVALEEDAKQRNPE